MGFIIRDSKIIHLCIDCNKELSENEPVHGVLRTFEYLEYRCKKCYKKHKGIIE